MNLVRGVALIGVAGACCGTGAAPDPMYSLAEKSGARVAVVGLPGGGVSVQAPVTFAPFAFPKLQVTLGVPIKVMPGGATGGYGGGFIPTEIHAQTELIPTQFPDAKIFWCNK